MSPPAEDAARQPSRRASSTILGNAWRNLTGSRPKSNSLAIAAAPSTAESDVTASAARDSGFSSGTAAQEDYFSFGADSSTSKVVNGDRKSLGSVVGGPSKLSQLLLRLQDSNSLSERTLVAREVSKIIARYNVSNILQVWKSGRDLIFSENDEARQAGYALLQSCVTLPNLLAIERQEFFKMINSQRDDHYFDARFDALVGLTNNGRNVDALEPYLLTFLTHLLASRYASLSETRKKDRKGKREKGGAGEAGFARVYDLLIEVIKFNSTLIGSSSFSALLDQVITICRNTTSQADIENSIGLINVLLTYATVPATALRPCLAILSDIYRQMEVVREQSWDALSNMFQSHLGQSAITELLQILSEPTPEGKSRSNIVCGAFCVLRDLFGGHRESDMPRVSLFDLLPALSHALEARDLQLSSDVLLFFQDIFANETLTELLLREADFTLALDVIMRSAETLSLRNPASYEDQELSRQTSGSVKGKERNPVDFRACAEAFCNIAAQLCALLPQLELIQKDAATTVFLRSVALLDDNTAEVLTTYCAEERLILPTNKDWLDVAQNLVRNILHNSNRPAPLRAMVVKILKDVYIAIEDFPDQIVLTFVNMVLEKIHCETDASILESLATFAVAVVEQSSSTVFETVLTFLRRAILQSRDNTEADGGSQPTSPSRHAASNPLQPSLCRVVVKQVIRMFIGNINKSATKAEQLYDLILEVAGHPSCTTDARICAIKCLFRLRSNADFAIYIRPLSESESLAAVLCRTADTAVTSQIIDEAAAAREVRNSATGGHQPAGGRKNFNIRSPIPPMWFYPGPKALPEEPPQDPSLHVFSHLDAESDDQRVLKLNLWLETVLGLIQQPDVDWEIYSYVLVHLGAQLANHNLFNNASNQIKLLRSVLCDQIRTSSFHEPPSHTSLKKADVAVCIYHILTILVSYSPHFAKSEEDEIVRAFAMGMGSWDGTSKWCIHALAICCHELPLSVSKSLDTILQKMSQIVTQPLLAVHILEFLACLARLPELYKNFTEDHFKTVFGVSFRYLQYVRDQQQRTNSQPPSVPPSRSGKNTMRHSDSFKELRNLSEQDLRQRNHSTTTDGVTQYVYLLAFHVITFWYMALKLEDRPYYQAFIARNLTYRDHHGHEEIAEQGIVTMDMMDKVAYSDRDDTASDPNFAKPSVDGEVIERTWIVGLSLLTIQTAGRTGVSQITRRRPSGTRYFIYRPRLTEPPQHQVPITYGIAADAFFTSAYIGVLPEDVLQDMYSSIGLAAAPILLSERPILLPSDDIVNRALAVFDRNPTVDGYKIGVIYIGEGQTTEREILCNTYGSTDYNAFVKNLGTLMRLKNAQFNTQGLDRSGDYDGKYAVCWRDRATEIVFHITTMMPTNKETDPYCTAKKSHIGNDYVNIVWNNSGGPFRFDTFPSAFNYMYIVITPETQPSFCGSRITSRDHTYYKVQVMSAQGIPAITPAAEAKIISAKNLPHFVRFLALNASVFSQVWQNRQGGEHFSPWRNRLREIKRLREKYVPATQPVVDPTSPTTSARPISQLTSAGSSSNLTSLLASTRQMISPSPVANAMPPPPTALHLASSISVPTLSNARGGSVAESNYGLSSTIRAGQIQQRSSLATFQSLSDVGTGTGSRSSFSLSEAGTEDH